MADYFSKFTGDQIDKVIDGRLHSPIQDIVGDNYTSAAPLIMQANTEYPFVCNGAIRNFEVLPGHVTKMWDTANNKLTFSEMLNTPMIVAVPQFTFKPGDSSAGKVTVRAYLHGTSTLIGSPIIEEYKGSPEPVSALFTFYAGDDPTFDVKNIGVSFTISADKTGEGYNMAIQPYRT